MLSLETVKIWHVVFTDKVMLAIGEKNISDETIEQLSDSVTCEVGKWLTAIRPEFEASERYQALVHAHQMFHHVIREFALLAQSSGFDDDQVNLARNAILNASNLQSSIAHAFEQEYRLQRLGVVGMDASVAMIPVPKKESSDLVSLDLGRLHAMTDQQHRKIVSLLEKLISNSESDTSHESVLLNLNSIIEVMAAHFDVEERFLAALEIPAEKLQRHKEGHTHILDEIITKILLGSMNETMSVTAVFQRILALFMHDVNDLDVEYWFSPNLAPHFAQTHVAPVSYSG